MIPILGLVIPWISQSVVATGWHPAIQNVLIMVLGIGISVGVAYLPACVPNYFSLRQKIRVHKLMIDQLSSYRLQDAKCAVESDRVVVEEKIAMLFSNRAEEAEGQKQAQTTEPLGRAAVVEYFNTYMQTEVKDALVARLGDSRVIPYRICCMVFMPLILSSMADILGCDNMVCHVAYMAEGYNSVAQQMISNAFIYFGGAFGIVPTSLPLMTHLTSWLMDNVSNSCLQQLLCVLAVVLSCFYMGFAWGMLGALILNAETMGIWWQAGLVLFCVFYALLNYRLFFQATGGPSPSNVERRYPAAFFGADPSQRLLSLSEHT